MIKLSAQIYYLYKDISLDPHKMSTVFSILSCKCEETTQSRTEGVFLMNIISIMIRVP